MIHQSHIHAAILSHAGACADFVISDAAIAGMGICPDCLEEFVTLAAESRTGGVHAKVTFAFIIGILAARDENCAHIASKN